jgi:hypothetical protein
MSRYRDRPDKRAAVEANDLALQRLQAISRGTGPKEER